MSGTNWGKTIGTGGVVLGATTMGAGFVPSVAENIGKYPKAAFDAVGLDLTEKQSMLAAGALIGAAGIVTRMLFKDKDSDEIESPGATPAAASKPDNGQAR